MVGDAGSVDERGRLEVDHIVPQGSSEAFDYDPDHLQTPVQDLPHQQDPEGEHRTGWRQRDRRRRHGESWLTK